MHIRRAKIEDAQGIHEAHRHTCTDDTHHRVIKINPLPFVRQRVRVEAAGIAPASKDLSHNHLRK